MRKYSMKWFSLDKKKGYLTANLQWKQENSSWFNHVQITLEFIHLICTCINFNAFSGFHSWMHFVIKFYFQMLWNFVSWTKCLSSVKINQIKVLNPCSMVQHFPSKINPW